MTENHVTKSVEVLYTKHSQKRSKIMKNFDFLIEQLISVHNKSLFDQICTVYNVLHHIDSNSNDSLSSEESQ